MSQIDFDALKAEYTKLTGKGISPRYRNESPEAIAFYQKAIAKSTEVAKEMVKDADIAEVEEDLVENTDEEEDLDDEEPEQKKEEPKAKEDKPSKSKKKAEELLNARLKEALADHLQCTLDKLDKVENYKKEDKGRQTYTFERNLFEVMSKENTDSTNRKSWRYVSDDGAFRCYIYKIS